MKEKLTICSRVRDNDYFDVDKFSNVHLTSFPSYLDNLSDEGVAFDVFLCKRSSSCCSLCHSNSPDKKCVNLESLIMQGTYLQPFVVFW